MMKTQIITLILATAAMIIGVLGLTGVAHASGGTQVTVPGAGTLSVGVIGNTTNDVFNTNTPTPIDPNAPKDISDRNDWQNHYVNVLSCTRVVFGIAMADTGWHCVSESEGHPQSPMTQTFTADQVQSQVNLQDGPGFDCTFYSLGACQEPTFPVVDLSQYYGLVEGTLYSNVCTDLDLTPTFGVESATPLGCSGTISTLGVSFASTCNTLQSHAGCEPPKPFSFKNRKHRAIKAKPSVRDLVRKQCVYDLNRWVCPLPAPR